jgi:hypothetical protein
MRRWAPRWATPESPSVANQTETTAIAAVLRRPLVIDRYLWRDFRRGERARERSPQIPAKISREVRRSATILSNAARSSSNQSSRPGTSRPSSSARIRTTATATYKAEHASHAPQEARRMRGSVSHAKLWRGPCQKHDSVAGWRCEGARDFPGAKRTRRGLCSTQPSLCCSSPCASDAAEKKDEEPARRRTSTARAHANNRAGRPNADELAMDDRRRSSSRPPRRAGRRCMEL